jgi:hypothetical protein
MKVYLVTDNDGLYKIGRSADVKKRLVNLQVGNPKHLEVLCEVEVRFPRVENIMHNRYKRKRAAGEWFALDPADVAAFEKDCREIDDNLAFMKVNSTLSHLF